MDEPSNFFRTEADLAVTDARSEKAKRTKQEGDPIELSGKPINIEVIGNELWTAESSAVVRRCSLDTGKTLQLYKGHIGPVTCLALFPSTKFLLTGSWDKTIKAWNTSTKELVCSVEGHSDFLKCLLIIPSMDVLVSGGSDKAIRFWDLSQLNAAQLIQLGTASSHSRPVECLAYDPGTTSSTSATYFSADSMGVIKVWDLSKASKPSIHCRAAVRVQLGGHTTGINDMWYGLGQLWTASTDCTVVVQEYPPGKPPGASIPPLVVRSPAKAILPLALTPLNEPLLVVGSGDTLSTYDVSTPERPELKGLNNAHWHDITAIRLWVRQTKDDSGRISFTPMIVSASLDGTVRRWTLKEMLSKPNKATVDTESMKSPQQKYHPTMTDDDLDQLLAED